MKSFLIEIKGIVQGVGFRPFVYNLAIKHGINGWVNNDDKGVNILIYSSYENCQNFLDELQKNPPKLSHIDDIKIEEIISSKEYKTFEIIQSETSNNKSTIILPDMGICADCVNDINDNSNFRHNYSLTNCTNCGPRYSIIKTVPYDRINTSMATFEFCKNCKDEYTNPTNRRYHAQPVACEICGPNITLYSKNNSILSYNLEAIKQIANLINEGNIVAIKGLGGFHLVCDAKNSKTIEELRLRKNRPTKPFAVMFKDINSIKEYCQISSKEEEILNSLNKPIVLVKKKNSFDLSPLLAPNITQLGCFITYTGLHYLLFRYLNNPIVATSANLKDEPIIKSKDEIIEKLSNVVDYILDFNREIINTSDDTVIQIVDNSITKIRNARGYAPIAINFKDNSKKKILALGANQKSTITLFFENNLILSPYIGDLNSLKSMEYFERTINTFKRFYDFEPEVIVCDKHPNYESTKFALKLKQQNPKIELVQIQHHYSHVLSVMAEYKLNKEVLAFIFDGTGYGDDGNIWGGEVFVASKKEYKRVNHFKYFKLLGGEMAVKEPKRVALSLLFDNFSLDEVLNMQTACVKAFKESEIKMLHTMWQRGLNSPLTSSVGRLFDAVASIANILHIQSYEGEAGLLIEQHYDKSILESYTYEINEENIDISSMIKEMILDIDAKLICSKFINTMAQIILDISKLYENLPVVLGGGVFQNRTLLELLINKFKKQNKEFYYNKNIPLNDGGISVGQAYYLI
jgi:hydrogenase maturation protein HypF